MSDENNNNGAPVSSTSPQELEELRKLSGDIAANEKSPWQPSCISAAFATVQRAFVFTMQAWINLDFVRSPILHGKLPVEGDVLHQLSDAVDAFDAGPFNDISPEEAIALGELMLEEVNRGFGMVLKMNPPAGMRAGGSDDGFGSWLPVLTCLISELEMRESDALATHVGQAFALIATYRHNQGWTCGGISYAQRD